MVPWQLQELTLLFMEDDTVKLVKAADHLKEICPDLVTEPLPEGSDKWNMLVDVHCKLQVLPRGFVRPGVSLSCFLMLLFYFGTMVYYDIS